MSYLPNGSEFTLKDDVTREPRIPLSQKFTRSTVPPRKSRSKRLGANGSHGSSNGADHSKYPIIVHCHLCWDWVWQRPQQFLSRLSHRHKILFVETIGPDPQLAAPSARFSTPEEFPNLTVLRIQFPTWRWKSAEFVDNERRRIVQEFIAGPGAAFRNAVQWFYDPMAVAAFGGSMDEILTVYDCMDELSKFRCAPPEIQKREANLLALADVVFTGGRKLYESKRRSNSNCHFHGCGVDVAHFGKARKRQTRVPDDLANLHKPILGYFGVVDERMDYELIAALADANPDWSLAIIGPVLKVDANSFPYRPNLHWLGQRPYEDLPAYCKGFDACLMPFALNESTEYINPTKALEYMAAGKPIISSAISDVVSNFSSVVKIAHDHNEFVALCKAAIQQPDAQAIANGLEMAAANSWESIVAQLESHIESALQKRRSLEVLP